MKRIVLPTVVFALGVGFWAGNRAGAAVVPLLINGSLETSLPLDQYGLVTASASKNSNALTGWTITAGSVDIVPNTVWQSAAGTFSVDMTGSPGLGGMTQVFATTIGTTYTLSFELSANPSALTGEQADTKRLLVSAGTVGAPVQQVVNAYTAYTVTVGTRTNANMQYIAETFQFTATWTRSEIAISALVPTGVPAGFNGANSFCGPVIDNLVLVAGETEPSPEPATLALLGAAVLGLLVRRGRRVAR